MTLKNLAAVAALVVLAGCTPNMQSLIITGVFPAPLTAAGAECTFSKPSVSLGGGSINAAYTSGYVALLSVDSLFVDNDLTPSGNIAVMDRIEVEYSASPGSTGGTPVPFPATETKKFVWEIKPDSQDNLLLLNLLGPKGADSLTAVPSPSNYFDLDVTVRLLGTLVSGGAVQTNRVTIPLKIYSQGDGTISGSGNACSPNIVNPTAACGNVGQDITCCEPDPMDNTKCKGG
jgi:hypothetical protein